MMVTLQMYNEVQFTVRICTAFLFSRERNDRGTEVQRFLFLNNAFGWYILGALIEKRSRDFFLILFFFLCELSGVFYSIVWYKKCKEIIAITLQLVVIRKIDVKGTYRLCQIYKSLERVLKYYVRFFSSAVWGWYQWCIES